MTMSNARGKRGPKAERSRMETLLLTPEIVSGFAAPSSVRALNRVQDGFLSAALSREEGFKECRIFLGKILRDPFLAPSMLQLEHDAELAQVFKRHALPVRRVGDAAERALRFGLAVTFLDLPEKPKHGPPTIRVSR